MTLANKLTLSRMISVLFFLLFMFKDTFYTRVFALFVFIAASITDLYDGIIARRRKETTNFGKFMDPLADKLLVSAALVSFVQLRELSIPAWMVVLIISREFIITGLRTVAATQGKVIAAQISGKFKTTSQMVSIITIMLILVIRSYLLSFTGIPSDHPALWNIILLKSPYWLMLITTVLTIFSGFTYLMRYKEILREDY